MKPIKKHFDLPIKWQTIYYSFPVSAFILQIWSNSYKKKIRWIFFKLLWIASVDVHIASEIWMMSYGWGLNANKVELKKYFWETKVTFWSRSTK